MSGIHVVRMYVHPAICNKFKSGVSNHWNGIWTGLEWNDTE